MAMASSFWAGLRAGLVVYYIAMWAAEKPRPTAVGVDRFRAGLPPAGQTVAWFLPARLQPTGPRDREAATGDVVSAVITDSLS
jgi:hypothetical protein